MTDRAMMTAPMAPMRRIAAPAVGIGEPTDEGEDDASGEVGRESKPRLDDHGERPESVASLARPGQDCHDAQAGDEQDRVLVDGVEHDRRDERDERRREKPSERHDQVEARSGALRPDGRAPAGRGRPRR